MGPSLAKHQKSKQHGAARDCFARNLLNLENNDTEFIDATLMANLSSDQKDNKEFLRQSFLATRLLTKQGLAFRGKTDHSSNFLNVMDHMSEVSRRKHKLQEQKKFASPEIQNEMIEILYRHLMKHKLVNKIKLNKHFCLICDEGTDSSNKEWLSIVLRQVDEDFVVKDFF